MNGISISKALKDTLPVEERADLEERLWVKSGGKCFLCGDEMNRSSEVLEADHDTPTSMGGSDEASNLNLVHRPCNRFKKNHPSTNVRPFLKFQVFVRNNGGSLKYDGAIPYFGDVTAPVVATDHGATIDFEFPDSTKRTANIYAEKRGGGSDVRYTFIDVPRSALFNDDKCQPRTLKMAHVWSILSDLQINPLHEPPAARLEIKADGKPQRLLMFDGQHKTVAFWLRGHDRVVAKVYLEMDAHSAITLVNSIQSKIKKLPLSPFELAAKLSDEWEGKLRAYEESVAAGEGSELGFLSSFSDPVEKRRAKEAFESALVQRVLSDSTLDLSNYVQKVTAHKSTKPTITENAVKKKVIERLLSLKSLPEKGEAMAAQRQAELQNIVRVLNQFSQSAFELGNSASPQSEDRMKRMMFQSSLQYIADLLRELTAHIVAEKGDKVFLRGDLSGDRWSKIEAAIQRIIDHPIWTADWTQSDRTKAVYEALQKNQNAEAAFEMVGLKLGYVVGADKLKPNALG